MLRYPRPLRPGPARRAEYPAPSSSLPWPGSPPDRSSRHPLLHVFGVRGTFSLLGGGLAGLALRTNGSSGGTGCFDR